MYDAFSQDYDRFVNWPGRLDFELPFIIAQLDAIRVEAQHLAPAVAQAALPGSDLRLLDAACGTGWHAIALAQRGYGVAAADLSAAMIDRARHNAAEAQVDIHLEAVGFGALA